MRGVKIPHRNSKADPCEETKQLASWQDPYHSMIQNSPLSIMLSRRERLFTQESLPRPFAFAYHVGKMAPKHPGTVTVFMTLCHLQFPGCMEPNTVLDDLAKGIGAADCSVVTFGGVLPFLNARKAGSGARMDPQNALAAWSILCETQSFGKVW